ncbi:MAG: BON domain-containing protein, partial [Gammaproteobacteria bacterium]
MNPTVQLPFQSRALPYLFLCFSLLVFCPLSGCTSWYMMTTPPGEPVDQDIGERTLGSKIEDMNIEAKIRANLLKADKDYRRGDITVTSYNGIVLLTGTVPSASLKQLATKLAQDTRRVRQVHNRLSVGANRSAGQKMHDGWLNFKVKSKLRANRL